MPPIDEAFWCARATPRQMDGLWAAGWRHFGPHFFRYDRTLEAGTMKRVLPLRVNVRAFAPSRSQRRALSRNENLRLEVAPAYVDAAALALFARHRTRFSHNVPDSLYGFVSSQPDRVPCPCLSLRLYLRGALVGASFLDVGETTCSSVYQMFEPEEAKRSLGVLMLLLSIHYAQKAGRAHYYPGYAYREPSHYDYKKRLAALEGYDWAGGWTPYRPP